MLILPSRRQFLTGLGAGAGLVAATGVYAFDVEPLHRLVVTPYAPTLPGWDPDLRLRIAVLADFHVCEPFMPFDRVAEIVDATNALEPDLILMLGDYPAGRIAWRKLPLTDFARIVEGLKAPLGTHAILGNHDWWDDHAVQRARRGTPAVKKLLEARGIPVLENQAVRLVKDGRPFWIAGLADQQPFQKTWEWVSFADVPRTLEAVTDAAPVILMAHEPDIFMKIPERVSLTLAGHTHGGQVRILGRAPAIRKVHGHDYSYGHVVQDGRHMIVSGGFGMSRIPVRFGVPPEIVLLDLGQTDRTPAA
ncbi:metallophosphoesterase [Methylobacterium mesophilicum SR1.6/6]|uniref:Metallophosphoesterase n=1 Tax=Methylobacterium mesophilicum SR1.6/6 TaxID=908290 RepID=A0A6B9FK82_9HYPH|nr:metallophosphoesterase [Methylobacterium mesophilicum]QGY02787.1 metallophosphoesterase [Methylobacterium mesophilicum SR1.6/6]